MALGVVFNGESCFFHGLYHQDVADDGHGGGRSRGCHAQYTYFLRFPGAEAYVGFVCQGAVGVSGDDDELQSRVQVMCQLCQLHDFASFARIGDAATSHSPGGCRGHHAVLRWGAGKRTEYR